KKKKKKKKKKFFFKNTIPRNPSNFFRFLYFRLPIPNHWYGGIFLHFFILNKFYNEYFFGKIKTAPTSPKPFFKTFNPFPSYSSHCVLASKNQKREKRLIKLFVFLKT
ncbi:hypothetical protein, partial [Staphylococcus aureus]|uniref:hypothetical protein n=1 Tax=Staphylococcus aureus TaxID=1280 RepID=UPI00272EE0A3